MRKVILGLGLSLVGYIARPDGAVDFLFKPIVPEVLRSKVAVFVELSRNNWKLKDQANELQRQAEVLKKAERNFRSLLEAAPEEIPPPSNRPDELLKAA